MDFFVDLFGLVSEGTEELPNIDATDGSEVEVMAWSNETACPRLEPYKVIGGGHDWPGAWGNMDIDASLVAWEFSKARNSTLPLSIEPALPSAQSTLQGMGHAGCPCPANAAGQLASSGFPTAKCARFSGLWSDSLLPSQRHLHADVRSVVYAVVRDRYGLETVRFIEVDGRFRDVRVELQRVHLPLATNAQDVFHHLVAKPLAAVLLIGHFVQFDA